MTYICYNVTFQILLINNNKDLMFSDLLISVSLISHLPEESALQMRKFEIDYLRDWSWDFLRSCFIKDLGSDSAGSDHHFYNPLDVAADLNKGVNTN